MSPLQALLGLCLFGISGFWAVQAEELKTERQGKLFSLLNIVKFQNAPCAGTGNKNGTCYTESECSIKGGSKAGTCASGYGVCCVFSNTCGQSSSENCTYFESSAIQAGACRLQICKCDINVCQLRLDFNTFLITGPSTTILSFAKAAGGIIQAAGTKDISLASRCLTDTFSVTNPGGSSPPTICGTNTGEHMFVDASDACNELAFQFGSAGMSSNRQWSIKITQYACDYDNLAPKGCTQYFFGTSTGSVQTFNYGGNIHLADQNQKICVRQERGNCRICYAPATDLDFSLSDKTTAAAGVTKESMCCGYGKDGMGTKGFDCLTVPGAEKKTFEAKMVAGIQFCGRKLVTVDGGTANLTICTTQRPFSIGFLSDSFEFQDESKDAAKQTKGFKLIYTQSGC